MGRSAGEEGHGFDADTLALVWDLRRRRVPIRDGAVANPPTYVALAVTAEDRREILGLWAGDGGEGAKSGCTSSRRSRTAA